MGGVEDKDGSPSFGEIKVKWGNLQLRLARPALGSSAKPATYPPLGSSAHVTTVADISLSHLLQYILNFDAALQKI